MGAYSDRVIADGASHYWRLGEPSGTTAADSIAGGANAPGTISGGVTLGQPGPLADGATAMTFNGTTGKVQTAANVSLMPPFTFEAWVKGVGAGDGGLVTNTAGGDGTADYYLLALYSVANGGRGRLYLEGSAGGSVDVGGVASLNDGQWHHLVGVFTAPTCSLYLDATLDKQVAGITLSGSTTKPVAIGTGVKYGMWYAGTLAEVAIYPLALTAPQIAAHYALRTATGGGGASGPPFPWPLALVLQL